MAAVVCPATARNEADMQSILTVMAIESIAPERADRRRGEQPEPRRALPARQGRRDPGDVAARLAAARPLVALPGPAGLVTDIVSGGEGSELYRVSLPDEYVGLSVDELSAKLRTEHRATLLAISRGGQTVRQPARGLRARARRRRGRGRGVARHAGAAADEQARVRGGPRAGTGAPPRRGAGGRLTAGRSTRPASSRSSASRHRPTPPRRRRTRSRRVARPRPRDRAPARQASPHVRSSPPSRSSRPRRRPRPRPRRRAPPDRPTPVRRGADCRHGRRQRVEHRPVAGRYIAPGRDLVPRRLEQGGESRRPGAGPRDRPCRPPGRRRPAACRRWMVPFGRAPSRSPGRPPAAPVRRGSGRRPGALRRPSRGQPEVAVAGRAVEPVELVARVHEGGGDRLENVAGPPPVEPARSRLDDEGVATGWSRRAASSSSRPSG